MRATLMITIIVTHFPLLFNSFTRIQFQDMLKPFYSSVDLSEVELANNNLGPRVSHCSLHEFHRVETSEIAYTFTSL